MKLGFISGRAIYQDDSLWTDAAMGRLIDCLRTKSECFNLCMGLTSFKNPIQDHCLQFAPDEFVSIPFMSSTLKGFFNIQSYKRGIQKIEASSDVVIMQLPIQAPLAVLGKSKPRVYHFCADVKSIVHQSTVYRGIRGIPAKLVASGIDQLHRSLCRQSNTKTVTNGEALLKTLNLPSGRAIVSSSIHKSEIGSYKRIRPQNAPFRVLFVGYLRHEKGIDLLFEAFQKILQEIPNAELKLIGSTSTSDEGIPDSLQALFSPIKHAVEFLGHLPFGDKLFQHFADSDVLVLPSRSEGTPRVLIEARAFGCPVIGTRVGGIPTSVKHEVDGLLVSPENVPELFKAILRVAKDSNLKETLIQGGYDCATQHTVESFADALLEEARKLYEQTQKRT